MKTKTKNIYICQECGFKSPKWLGKCPDCQGWDTLVEETEVGGGTAYSGPRAGIASPTPLDLIDPDQESRIKIGISEFDRVLGGGIVAGSVILIGGDPGIGKSTLMLQALYRLAENGVRTLYVSGEESVKQIRLRSHRLGTVSGNILVASEVDIDLVLSMVEKTKPQALVIDSIQTAYNSNLSSAPGSIGQVRESAMRLMLLAKGKGIPTFLIGHVTKEGAIAGPRLLEHMVDTVLYFEGDKGHMFRILRAVKNRFGSTNEIGVFEMKEKGLAEVLNPSSVFLSERPFLAPGSVVTACIEGTRPILVEIQALTSSMSYGSPRRTILGLDHNRVALLAAVMEKKLGMHLLGHDIFMNVAGGVEVDEPAVDMGIVSAIASSFLDKPLPEGTVVLGEVGLTGEVRAVSHIESRIMEMKKMGFSTCLMPESNAQRCLKIENMALVGIRTISEGVERLF